MKLAAVLLLLTALAWGDAGVLIPSNREQPDASVLSLEEMSIDVRIDNGDARVEIRQIFLSHESRVLEGNYLFALPGRATVSDFAVWDDVTRIPGVILERRRAEELYQEIKAQAIDPGLLQMGERDADEARRTAVFSARIVPIPGFGTKRLEIEYHETIPVEKLKCLFAVPLRPDAYQAQTAARLRIHFELRSEHALANVEVTSKTYPLKISESTPHLFRGTFEGRNVAFNEDFAVRYSIDAKRADHMEVLAHREANEPGFFEASALIAPGQGSGAGGGARTVVALFDNSLSMQWEKLERNFQALETLLHMLRPADRFNLVLFNTEVKQFAPAPVAAETAAVEKALEFVRASRLRGGTDLERALEAALAQFSGGESYLVLLSDGDATRGTIRNAKLASGYAAKWKQARPRDVCFRGRRRCQHAAAEPAGAQRRDRRMGALDRAGGVQAQRLPGEDRAAAHRTAPARGRAGGELRHDLSGWGARRSPGSEAAWVGQYKKPLAGGIHGAGRARGPAAGAARPGGAAGPERGASAVAANVGAGAGGRPAREDRAGGRGPRQHRRDHPAGAQVQVRHALHVVPGGAARAAAAAR